MWCEPRDPAARFLTFLQQQKGRPKVDARAFDLRTVKGDGRCMFRSIAR